MRSGRDSSSCVGANRRSNDRIADAAIQTAQGLTRRNLVGRSLVASAGVLAAGNAARPLHIGAQEATPEEGGMVAQSPPVSIALDLRGGDAWTWEKMLAGTCAGCPLDATIALLINGA